jgi:hypothetical protein
MHRLRPRITYANLMSTLAVVLVVGGGTAYAAITIPRNSVGSAQIRTSAVGTSELRSGAVHKTDIAKTTIASLRGAKGDQGPQGPAGAPGTPGTPAVSYFAVVSGAGEFLRGNASNGGHTASGSGSYTVGFSKNVSGCAYSVTLGGIDATSQPPGSATVRDDGGKVGVQLYDTAGNPVDRSFHLVVAC